MDFSGKQVVVTGGTGALGTAVVGALLGAGARCTVPCMIEVQAKRFPHANDPNVTLIDVSNLANETGVAKVYDGLTSSGGLWASIHIAGGFAAGTLKAASPLANSLEAGCQSDIVEASLLV